MIALLLPVFGCSGVDADSETGLVAYPVYEPPGILVTIAEWMPTVLEVAWESEDGVEQFVEFGYDESYGTLAPVVDGEAGRAVLLGLKAETLVHARILTVRDGQVFASSDFSEVTGPLPDGLPERTVDVPWDPSLHERFAMLSVFDETTGGSVVFVMDGDADVVWWELVPRANVMTAHRAEEGRAMLYRTDDIARAETGEVVRARWDGTLRETLASPGGHHDVAEIEPGVVATIEEDIRDWDGETVVGDRLVEYGPDGTSTVVWSTWDWTDPVRTGAWSSGAHPRGVDWTHANGIDHDPETDTYLVSMAAVSTVVRLSRATGEVVWELGGDTSDYLVVGDAGFGPQHAPVGDDGSVWMFDNHNLVNDPSSSASRLVQFALDDGSHEATPAWEWTDPEESLTTTALGDVQPLADGFVFSTWGLLERMIVVAPTGEIAWQVSLPERNLPGRGEMFRSFYGLEDIELPE